MGSSIHKYKLTLDDYEGRENCPEVLVRSKPEVIAEIHESFFKVGCDVVETDTFGGSPVVLAEFGLAEEAFELNRRAALLAREVASAYSSSKRRYVSGSIGPTTKIPSLGHISMRAMQAAYFEQVRGLVDGGVDVLQFETGQDLLQAKAAVLAMQDVFKLYGRSLPVICQVTLEAPPLGTMLVGTDITAALTTLLAFPVDIIGINCATGPSEMIDPVRYLCNSSPRPVSVLPNAGLPENIDGETVYKLSPEELARSLGHFARVEGVNIVGGCCGTTPEHLAAVVDELGNLTPRRRDAAVVAAAASIYTAVPFSVDQPPLIVGERTNTNGSKKFKDLLQVQDLDGMAAMARSQEKEGAHILDVCTAYVGRDEAADMTAFLRRLNTEAQTPIMIDTTEMRVLEEALPLLAGRPIVNSINLEDGVDNMLAKVRLIKKYGAAAVALTIDEKGMAKDADSKIAVARRIYDLCLSQGMNGEDLIFDALTFTLSTGNDEDRKLGLATLEAIKRIKAELPGVRTILGVSNISFGFAPRIRRILNSVFLHYAVEAGLDMAIVNAQKILPLYRIAENERELHRRLIFDIREDGGPVPDPLFALLDYYRDKKEDAAVGARKKDIPVEEELKQRIIDGDRVGLEDALSRALKQYKPLEIINDILLGGMKVVGELFGSGKMQLPFVLQSAETMKAAVSFLEPLMEKLAGASRGTMVLATVKGDVHDIGKNLVDIILSNNGYRVINLGIKQPIENIIAAAQEHAADCIGMSGLLVKSTVIMKENLEILNERGITMPVILGGAALTRRYVEEDCARVYAGKLFYGQDAFDDLYIMERLGKSQAGEPEQDLKPERQEGPEVAERIRLSSEEQVDGNVQRSFREELLEEAQSITEEAAPQYIGGVASADSEIEIERNEPVEPPFWGSRVVEDFDLAEVFQYINENALIRGQFRVRRGDMKVEEYERLLSTKVRPVLAQLQELCIQEKLLRPAAVYGYFPCRSTEDGDDLIVYHPAQPDAPGELREWLRFTFPRQNFGRRLCISDFFINSGGYDVLPLQVVTMGSRAGEYAHSLFKNDRYSDYLYFHGLSVECAEALAELMHKRIRAELGLAAFDSADRAKLFQQGYRGTRYSFGYPACPDLEDQAKLFTLLQPERIGVSLTEEFQLVPEQSTSAVVVVHPQAKYFNIKKSGFLGQLNETQST